MGRAALRPARRQASHILWAGVEGGGGGGGGDPEPTGPSDLWGSAVFVSEPVAGTEWADATGTTPAPTEVGTVGVASAFVPRPEGALDGVSFPGASWWWWDKSTVPHPLGTINGDFTVHAVIDSDTDTNVRAVVGNGADANSRPGWRLVITSDGAVQLWLGDGVARVNAVAGGGWTSADGRHAYTGVVSFTDSKVYHYRDGLLVAESDLSSLTAPTPGAPWTPHHHPAVGNYRHDSGVPFVGSALVSVFDRALTDDEVHFLGNYQRARAAEEIEGYADGALVDWVLMGPPTTDSFEIAAHTGRSTLVAKLYSESGGTYTLLDTQEEAPNGAGLHRFTFSGLDPDTAYHVRFETPGGYVDARECRPRTAPTSGVPPFAVWSCADTSYAEEERAFLRMVEQGRLLAICLGDFDYWDPGATATLADFRAAMDVTMKGGWQRRHFTEHVHVIHLWSDHELTPDGDSTDTPLAAAQTWHRETWPGTVYGVASGPIDQYYQIGDLHLIIPDLRSERVISTLTMMSSAQMGRVKGALSAAASAGALVALCSEVMWQYAPTPLDDQSWAQYTSERQEIWDHMAGLSGLHVVTFSGDQHMSGDDDGTNHAFDAGGVFGVNCLHCSRMSHSFGQSKGTWSEFTWEGTGGNVGIVDVTPNAGAYDVTWKIIQGNGDTRHTRSFTV